MRMAQLVFTVAVTWIVQTTIKCTLHHRKGRSNDRAVAAILSVTQMPKLAAPEIGSSNEKHGLHDLALHTENSQAHHL